MTIELERLRELASTVRLDLRRYDFKERERLILETILDFSFECGREMAVIQKLDDFAELTGMSRGNVHSCLKALVVIGVLSVEGTVYRVLPRSAGRTWQVRPSVNLSRAEALSRQLRELNSVRQGELIREEPTLKESLAVVALEAAVLSTVPESGTCEGSLPIADRRSVPRLGTSVPESGTDVPELGTPLSFKRKEATSASSLKRYGAVMGKERLPEVRPEDMNHVPEFCNNAYFQAWCIALEAKHGGWMGTGNAETWAESYGGLWWKRWKENPGRFRAVWNDTLEAARTKRISDSIGGYAHDLWVHERVG